MTEGHDLISKLLLALQTYKSSGAVDRAKKLYEQYSQVPDDYRVIREIIK
jgi:hypothetical protein